VGEGLGVRALPLGAPVGVRKSHSLPHPRPFSLREKGVRLPSPLVGEGLGVRDYSPLPLGEGRGVRALPLGAPVGVRKSHSLPHPRPFSLREKGVRLPSPPGRGVGGEGLLPSPPGRGAGGEGLLPSPLVGEGLGVRAYSLLPLGEGRGVRESPPIAPAASDTT